ncbi:MAG: N-6 DNA methylase, partial [Helicobacteraceae bacterium]|nr:N-6 DNA methylase [Helicobacteraceae bacterium]
MITEYIDKLSKARAKGNATEHTYRPYLQTLIESFGAEATNEPSRIECGAPDFIVEKGALVIGYVEAKDIGENLDSPAYKSQFDRYKAALENLVITDYMTFRFFRVGELYGECSIARLTEGATAPIAPIKENFERLKELFNNFINSVYQTIANASELAKIMATKTRLMQEVINNALNHNAESYDDKSLLEQYQALENVLIKNLSKRDFADIYAQTIAYGMFAARIHSAEDSFTRQNAASAVPHSNPFLRRFFAYIASVEIDRRIAWIIDDLAAVFNHSDMFEILRNFGKASKMDDPVIHFYETFLNFYDPAARKKRGVYYTPLPVTNFIVRAVNDLLKSEFGLREGLGDASKIKKNAKEEHLVQILDPAAGTGAFLAEVIRVIYDENPNKGAWNSYVIEHLIPRLFGLELLMASYAMAHLKLDVILKETGFINKTDQRFNIFLSNSLEGEKRYNTASFYGFIAEESALASKIKQESPIMVVLGNPPYSAESANKNEWIGEQLEVYKQEPSGGRLKEKNFKGINDDYVKFIRLAEHFIERKQSGIVAYINNHGFLDNPTFRGMRYHLLQMFDKIYIVDLHGNVMKKESATDGSKDENVFDIQQGVSINIFVKTDKKSKGDLAKVYHIDLFGLRKEKYQWLAENKIFSEHFSVLKPIAPNYFFTPKDFSFSNKYGKNFSIHELFSHNSVGVVTSEDAVFVNTNKRDLAKNISNRFAIKADESLIANISYRPFDDRFIYYDASKIGRARDAVMRHFLNADNVGLIFSRQAIADNWSHIFLTKSIIDSRIAYSNKGLSSIAPLYLCSQENKLGREFERTPNVNTRIVKQISKNLNLSFTPEKENDRNSFAPIDLLDYIYAVLHSPTYREKYKEFLKIDFPRVPYPKDATTFWRLAELGKTLRELHLLESLPHINATFPKSGNNIVEKIVFADGKVHINADQYFGGVSQNAWEFYIGGYQPAQKWLKDRKNETLSFDDIAHYTKIVTALDKTTEIM